MTPEQISQLVLSGDGNVGGVTGFSRLVEVRDRHGNRLVYHYPAPGTLIPDRISDPDRPGHQIQIVQNDGLVTAVRGPDGQTVNYNYLNRYLWSVSRSGGAAVFYGYHRAGKTAATDVLPQIVQMKIQNVDPIDQVLLASITDERGVEYSFNTISPLDVPGMKAFFHHDGQPRIVTTVKSPAGMVELSGTNPANAQSYSGTPNLALFEGVATRLCAAADGSATQYTFSAPVVYHPIVDGMGKIQGDGGVTFTFTQMVIARSKGGVAFGSESYLYQPTASFALASATDLSGNTTVFTYGADGFDDPLTETSFLQTPAGPVSVTKHFTYDPETRVMTSMTDPMGVKTVYTIDNSRTITRGGTVIPVKGLKTVEKVFDSSNNLLRETRYSYDHPVFAGLVTKEWSVSSNEEVMPSSVTLTTLGTPGSAGFTGGWSENASRAWILNDQNGPTRSYFCGWWRELTATTGTATPSGGLGSVLSVTEVLSDLGGKKRQVIDARGYSTSFDYDTSGRLTRVDHPDQSFKTLEVVS